jgi:hypothetical protein
MERRQSARESKKNDCSQVEALGEDFRRAGSIVSHHESNLPAFILQFCLHFCGLERQNAGIVPRRNVARENEGHREPIKNQNL